METVTEKDTTYNGWKNYETWSVKLILDNDERLYHEARERVQNVLRAGNPSEYWEEGDWQRYALADHLKDWMERASEVEVEPHDDQPLSFLWSQLISAALSEVDWNEVAVAYLEDLDGS